MRYSKLAGAIVLVSLVGTAAVAGAAQSAAAPDTTTIKVLHPVSIKPNRYAQDGLRWDKDVYHVKSGGTLRVVNTAASEGPHTFTVVEPKDLPKTGKQALNCSICNRLAKAHGADPSSNAPPKFPFLENGVGQKTAPLVDRPGDSGITGKGKQGESIKLKVTAPAGTTLTFMCIIHSWMQAKVTVD
jgi:hypothetical protein